MTEFNIENHKMAEFNQGKRALGWLDRHTSARLVHGSVEARAIDWST
jgi:hypothetical protein